ncbi:Hsp20/alpha crystallin family protein [Methanofollis fontis]|uniref:Uncharacterized protein n=1 Tax=Methanofollis fontis TaxID=2052832 RepID=A0A483CVS6_9EURY|nr:Hsp20/alpha crystallin family protein [Methanofollis fontis]TAJ45621.1 hypothetical protein CUJ86_02555 [Methanofollis fontis]
MKKTIPDEDFQQLTEYIKGMVLDALNDNDDKPIAVGIRVLVREGHCHVLPPTWRPAQAEDGATGEEVPEEIEPRVEVTEAGKELIVTADLPGVSEEGIRVWQDGCTVHIVAEDGQRRYRRVVDLPPVTLDVEAMSYHNGVLDLVFSPRKRAETAEWME